MIQNYKCHTNRWIKFITKPTQLINIKKENKVDFSINLEKKNNINNNVTNVSWINDVSANYNK